MISSSKKNADEKKNGRNGKQPQPPQSDADFKFLALSILPRNLTKAYRTAYQIDEDHYDREDSRSAKKLQEQFLATDIGHYFMKGVQYGLGINPDAADTAEIIGFFSNAMRGQIQDQFGLDPALADRLKAGETLAKIQKLLTNSIEVKADTSFADALSRARRRVAKGERDAP